MLTKKDTYTLHELLIDANKKTTLLNVHTMKQGNDGSAEIDTNPIDIEDQDVENMKKVYEDMNITVYKTAEREKDIVVQQLIELPESLKLKRYNKFVQDVIAYFDKWFINNDYEELILTSSGENFKHFNEYSTVRLNDSEYQLTVNQSKVVKILHRAHKERRSWLRSTRIFDEARIQADKMSDVFKNHKEIMHALIEYNRSRQQYRLKL